jgi:osmoprotectant transport system ATP-binding protein
MTAPSPVIALEGVCKRFGDAVALGPVDFALGQGEIVALIGPSGCGKSTALRLMLGLVRPDQGRVSFQGAPVLAAQWRPLRQRIGYVVQDGGLFPHLTAGENIAVMAEHLGWPRERTAARTAELLALARLPNDVLTRYPMQLSGGQRQRVSLLRALFLDPEVLLLDEPLGALDPLVRVDLQADLAAVFAGLRKSVVIVTHDLGEAAFFARRLVLLRDGRIVQQGPFADLLDRPAEPFVTQFVSAQRGPWAEAVRS